MRLKARLEREWRFLRSLRRTLGRVKSIATDSPNLICDDLQAAVEKWRDRPAMTFEGRTVSYGELDAIVPGALGGARNPSIIRDLQTDQVIRGA